MLRETIDTELGEPYLPVVEAHLRDDGTQWSMGTFGAIAEFLHDPGEPTVVASARDNTSIATARGAVRLVENSRARLVASETVGRAVGTWRHSVAICLPENACAMHGRDVVTELGPDQEAVRLEDRPGVLFDIGLALAQTDACIRTSDSRLIAALRASEGRSLFESGNPVMTSILEVGPHRVFLSRLGRVEVFQPIPPPTGKSPLGPHTHIMPKLLRARRTHSATTPIPAGWVPCASFYPAHPQFDAEGLPRPFVRAHFEAFTRLFERHGDEELVAVQRRVTQAVFACEEPQSFPASASKFARANLRIALRKLKASGETSPVLDRWIARHDRAAADDGEDEAQHAC